MGIGEALFDMGAQKFLIKGIIIGTILKAPVWCLDLVEKPYVPFKKK